MTPAIVQYGIGTFGSRATAVGGTAVFIAIQKLKEKAAQDRCPHAAMRCFKSVVRRRELFRAGRRSRGRDRDFRTCRAGGRSARPVRLPEPQTEGKTSLTIQEIALAAHIAKELPPDTEPGLSATYFFEPKNFTFPFGTHICVVEIDRETGDIKFVRYVAVDDCGKVINPMLVDGQVHGGIVQSIGQALYEEVVYDDQGQLVTGNVDGLCGAEGLATSLAGN